MSYFCVGCGVTFMGVARDFSHCVGREIGSMEAQRKEDARREAEMRRVDSRHAGK